jgi:serine/threonine protein kinase
VTSPHLTTIGVPAVKTKPNLIRPITSDNHLKNEERVVLFCSQLEKLRETNPGSQPLQLKDLQIGLQIGQGAFAIVRRVIHKESQAVLALKTYDKKTLCKQEAKEAVHSEINILSAINHQNVMRLYEVID